MRSDSAGHARLRVEVGAFDAAGTPTALTTTGLLDGEHHVVLRDAAGSVAAAHLPRLTSTPTPSGRRVAEVALMPQHSPVSGRLELHEANGHAAFVVTAQGLAGGVLYPVHLHQGTPGAHTASFGALGSLTGDSGGRGLLEASGVRVSASGTWVQLAVNEITRGEHYVDIHLPSGAVAATARIPGFDRPSAPPTTPTGEGSVDRLIAAVHQRDGETLAAWVEFTRVPCRVGSADGFPVYPECRPGELAGTLVPAIPAAACEGYWERDPRRGLGGLIEQAGDLYLVTAGPASVPPEVTFPPPFDRMIAYRPRSGSFVGGIILYANKDGSIVAFEAACRPLPDYRTLHGQELRVLWIDTEPG